MCHFIFSQDAITVYILVYSVLMCVRWSYRRCGSSEGQTQQHQQRDELVARLHVGHGEVTVVATVAHHRGGQHICQLQEIQGHQGGQDDGELGGHMHTHTHTHTHAQGQGQRKERPAFSICSESGDSSSVLCQYTHTLG